VKGFLPASNVADFRIATDFEPGTASVYAPTEDTEDEIVDEFYETSQSVCDEIPKHDAIVTLGDFNTKLGKEHLYKDVIGRHSLHEVTNNNGLR